MSLHSSVMYPAGTQQGTQSSTYYVPGGDHQLLLGQIVELLDRCDEHVAVEIDMGA